MSSMYSSLLIAVFCHSCSFAASPAVFSPPYCPSDFSSLLPVLLRASFRGFGFLRCLIRSTSGFGLFVRSSEKFDLPFGPSDDPLGRLRLGDQSFLLPPDPSTSTSLHLPGLPGRRAIFQLQDLATHYFGPISDLDIVSPTLVDLPGMWIEPRVDFDEVTGAFRSPSEASAESGMSSVSLGGIPIPFGAL
jgi:hypothetical protein